jgi:hypothetical protein
MQRRWTEVQELVGKFIIQVGEEVLRESLHMECLVSPVGNDGCHTLDNASDTRWDKRGSTRRCNSLSGCTVVYDRVS